MQDILRSGDPRGSPLCVPGALGARAREAPGSLREARAGCVCAQDIAKMTTSYLMIM